MEYSKDILIENIYKFARSKELNMKELEVKSGVSVGYFLRMRKDKKAQKTTSPTLYTMLHVSEMLGVSIEALVGEKPRYDIPDNTIATVCIDNEKEKRKEYIMGYIDGVKSIADAIENKDKEEK